MLTWIRTWREERRQRLLVKLAEGGRPPPSEAERSERPRDAELQAGWGAGEGGGRRAVYGYKDEGRAR